MKAGDVVSFVNEQKKGIIISIDKNKAVILNEFDFEETVGLEEVILRDEVFYSEIEITAKDEAKNKRSKKNTKAALILDLHFQNLVDRPALYSAQERLEIQREKLISILEFCKKNPIKKLNIIHGIGDGILQKLVFSVLENFADIQYEDENIFHESSGNVEVIFR